MCLPSSNKLRRVINSVILTWFSIVHFSIFSLLLLLLLQHLPLLTSSVFLSFLLSFLINVRPQPFTGFLPPPLFLSRFCFLFVYFLSSLIISNICFLSFQWPFGIVSLTLSLSFYYLPVILNYFHFFTYQVKKKANTLFVPYHRNALKRQNFFFYVFFFSFNSKDIDIILSRTHPKNRLSGKSWLSGFIFC